MQAGRPFLRMRLVVEDLADLGNLFVCAMAFPVACFATLRSIRRDQRVPLWGPISIPMGHLIYLPKTC